MLEKSTSIEIQTLEISFNSHEIRELAEDEMCAGKNLGPVVAIKLKNRLADMLAAGDVSELIAGNPSELNSTPKGLYSIEIGKSQYIHFSSNHVDTPLDRRGLVKWPRVTRIKILMIGGMN